MGQGLGAGLCGSHAQSMGPFSLPAFHSLPVETPGCDLMGFCPRCPGKAPRGGGPEEQRGEKG